MLQFILFFLTKPKARSGLVRKFNFFDWLDCERMTKVLSPVNAMACAQKVILCKVFSSVQINVFTEEVVFRLNINCKSIFILSLKTFQNSLSISIKTFIGFKKYRIEVDAYDFEALARAL